MHRMSSRQPEAQDILSPDCRQKKTELIINTKRIKR